MKHPLSDIYLFIYLLFWLIILSGHTLLLVKVNNFGLTESLIDTAILYPLLAGFGLSYYYVVRYLSPEARISLQDIAIHFAGILVVVCLIVYGHDEVVSRIIDQPEYSEYLAFSIGWRIASAMLLMSLMVVVYYMVINNRLMKAEVAKKDSIKALLRQTEMEMLRFQINPHFIFNSLNSISSLTMTSPERAQEMVIKLSDFFRKALGTDQKEMHTIGEELKQIDLYLDIERIRFGDRLVVSKEIDTDCDSFKIPAMILQPLYENAIKHGVYENTGRVDISTKVSCTEGSLRITVENTYDPMHNGRMNGTGIGLKNVRARLELMYGIPDLVTIERTNDRYKIHLLIPEL